MEIDLIARYDTTNPQNGYNKSIGGDGGANGLKLTESQKRHLSEVKKGKNPHIWTDEMRKKQSISQKGHKGYTKGCKLSEETKLRISTSLKGHKVSESVRLRYSKPVSQYSIDGVYIHTFYSRKEAARRTGVNVSSITLCVQGKRKQAGGFIWKKAKGE